MFTSVKQPRKRASNTVIWELHRGAMEEAEGLSWQGCIASCLVSISVFDTPQTSGEYILNQKRTKGSEKVNHKLDQGTHING